MLVISDDGTVSTGPLIGFLCVQHIDTEEIVAVLDQNTYTVISASDAKQFTSIEDVVDYYGPKYQIKLYKKLTGSTDD